MFLRASSPVAAIVVAALAWTRPVVADENYRAEIVPQMGHWSSVTSVAVSRDGRFVLSGSDDKTLKLWETATGKELRGFNGHNERVNAVALSPDGRLALSGSSDKTLKLWDLATGKELRSFAGHKEQVNSVALSPDGRYALSGGVDGTVRLWEAATGKQLRSVEGDTSSVLTVVFSPDSRFVLSGGTDGTLKLWDLPAGNMVRSFRDDAGFVDSLAFSPDGRFVLSSSIKQVKLWDVATGKELRNFIDAGPSVAFSPDGRFVLSGGRGVTMTMREAATGKAVRTFKMNSGGPYPVAFSHDGRFVLSATGDNALKLWEVDTGRELRSFTGHTGAVYSAAFSPDGRFALSVSAGHTLKLWDTASGRVLKSLGGHTDVVWSVVFSPDGRLALSASNDTTLCRWDLTTSEQSCLSGDTSYESVAISPNGRLALSGSALGPLKLWDVTRGSLLRNLSGNHSIFAAAFSPDGRLALATACPPAESDECTLMLWETATGKQLRSLGRIISGGRSVVFSPDGHLVLAPSGDTLVLFDVAAGKELRTFRGHTGPVESVAFSPNARFVLSGSDDSTLKLWETATGKELRSFKGHTSRVWSGAFSPDGRLVLSGSDDGTARIWDAGKGQELVRTASASQDDWLTITPSGFFTASRPGTDMLAIVRGLELTTSGQVHQSLYNPDLVREAIAGDPNHGLEAAAKVINLDKVLDAGPPPAVAITSHEPGTRTGADLVTVSARITDRGRGIGRIEWRLNGVTAGVANAPAGPGPDHDVSQELALDAGENRIEVIAYEGHNLLASLPAQSTIIYDSSAGEVKPKLYIFAIGINRYVDKGWNDMYFPPLTGSVPDAKAFSAEMATAGLGQYEKVRVTLALDEDATLNKLDEAVTKIASEISPRDTFVLYAAAHGYSLGGNYYLIPQDYQGGGDPQALKTRAVSQEGIQVWLASRIKAKRAIILLDTCESGALTGGYAKSRTEGTVSEAAVGRLHEATGRPVLTAASPGKSAYENYKGHGVFTYALMEALHKGDTNNNGKIEVTELAAHVERRVPELFAELRQNGFVVKGLAVAPVRRGKGEEEEKTQSAHFGSTGEDFSLVARLP